MVFEELSQESPEETGFPRELAGGVDLEAIDPEADEGHLEGQVVRGHQH